MNLSTLKDRTGKNCALRVALGDSALRNTISRLDDQLEKSFRSSLKREPSFTRQLVSFQGNKTRPGHRWYKYKEGFSASLVESFLGTTGLSCGTVLDPFAGSGTTLFSSVDLGWKAEGIELLPIGQEIIVTRAMLRKTNTSSMAARLETWVEGKRWKRFSPRPIPELRITQGAYPSETRNAIGRYLAAIEPEDDSFRQLLRFTLLCVLESVSYTRKDGQYLRWDYRSGRRQGKRPFDKGTIHEFSSALIMKAREIATDLYSNQQAGTLFVGSNHKGEAVLHPNSCLDVLPNLHGNQYNAIITSPPYCNRYDYTRTYALELALLGVTEEGLRSLRQQMLTCTVENKPKIEHLSSKVRWEQAMAVANKQPLLQAVLAFLEAQKDAKLLNNNGIPRMVRGYFCEMACVINECYRLLRSGGLMVMVNDNVRYCGENISVDLILSDMARSFGFSIQNILVLPGDKGNSSQQMGEHGRKPLRKCVYIWRK